MYPLTTLPTPIKVVVPKFNRSRNAKYKSTYKEYNVPSYGSYAGSNEPKYITSTNSNDMTARELINYIDEESDWVLKSKANKKVFKEPERIQSRLVREGKGDFNRALDDLLNDGYEIPTGESMKIHDGLYTILVIKNPKNTNKIYL